jgi:hypothetical protein|tara:strand:- start:1768 stop:1962 length:195 start_codon:yes stop_codon:yes gene_type:complete
LNIATLLRVIEDAQATLAKDSLMKPAGRDVFEYGRAVGMYAGLEHAKDLIIGLVAERERKDFDL